MNASLRAGQVAEAVGVNVETLRYYERRGIIGEPERSLGGHRLYPEATVKTMDSPYAQTPLLFARDGPRFRRVTATGDADALALGGARPFDLDKTGDRARRDEDRQDPC